MLPFNGSAFVKQYLGGITPHRLGADGACESSTEARRLDTIT